MPVRLSSAFQPGMGTVRWRRTREEVVVSLTPCQSLKVLQKAMAASKAVSCGAHQQQDGLKNQAGGNLQP
ncbi:hypothetical protein PSTG_16548 [Puccinia striiformis f. sp. tritici PST-78]|uniref:Uncharacterized protein n=1 Tax=Puccinia striiformis f. sp. tritici PST-78 TaxID=1165861 RepID=A0A0L0USF5_9BASI|nr:hypothetical protein PSTG_16548 [Puccinia striiformis f. sp. tritici PST-78]